MKPRSQGWFRAVYGVAVSTCLGTYGVAYAASRPLRVIILVCSAVLAITTLLDIIRERRSISNGQVSK
jgi:hypothetical protein